MTANIHLQSAQSLIQGDMETEIVMTPTDVTPEPETKTGAKDSETGHIESTSTSTTKKQPRAQLKHQCLSQVRSQRVLTRMVPGLKQGNKQRAW